MKKILISGLIFSNFLFGYNLKYSLNQNQAFLVKENKKILNLEFDLLNDSVDILNLKQTEHIDKKKFGSIGDLKGFKLSTLYGLSKKGNIGGYLDYKNIEYTDGELNNYQLNLFYRYNYLYNFFTNTSVSVDIGATFDRGRDLKYKNINLLNYLVHKIKPQYSLVFSNNSYYVKDNKNNTYAKLNERPFIKISNMNDTTFYLKLIVGKKLQRSILNGFLRFGHTYINTKISPNSELVEKGKAHGYNLKKDLKREENVFNIGVNYSIEVSRFLLEIEYYYTRLFRNKHLDYIKYNHVLNLDVVTPLSKKVFLFLGGKIMYRQFNGEIPYLYNKYSQTTFDHKYGWARFGIGFNF